MDFYRQAAFGVDFKDFYKHSNSVHLHIDAVLVDKSSHPSQPSVYELFDADTRTAKTAGVNLLGEVKAIDTTKKLITLTNDNIITYKYLITATRPGSPWINSPPTKELAAGVQLLLGALRMQSKIPQDNVDHAPPNVKSCQKVQKEPHIPSPKSDAPQSPPDIDPKTVYQVHL